MGREGTAGCREPGGFLQTSATPDQWQCVCACVCALLGSSSRRGAGTAGSVAVSLLCAFTELCLKRSLVSQVCEEITCMQSSACPASRWAGEDDSDSWQVMAGSFGVFSQILLPPC